MNSLHNDNISISRTTTLSRAGSKKSTGGASSASRAQSLIKKNIAPNDLRPSDILIERFTAWKMIVKQLIGYFEGLAEIHNETATSLIKLSGHIQVPFRTGNQFLDEGGIQDMYYSIRDKTRLVADQHAGFAKTIEGSIVGHLNKLRAEIKAHIKNIKSDTGKLATTVAKERELSTKLISELAKTIAHFKNTPMTVGPKEDPYVANMAVSRQLLTQVHAENALQKSIIIIQAMSATFESSLIQSLQSAHGTFADWNSRTSSAALQHWDSMAKDVQQLDGEREWLAFAGREDHLLDPETPLRNPETIEYPSKEDPSVTPIQTGWLERKKRFTRTYRESYYVLTPAGYLHEFETSDPSKKAVPSFSIFLPNCTLGPPSSAKSKSHKFHIETNPDKDSASTGSSKSRSIFSRGGGHHSYTFRARSHTTLLEWWNDLRMLCKRYLVATEAPDRSGPVSAAVRSVGYTSEGEGSEFGEDDEEEGEGSSIEEEEDEEGEDAGYVSAPEPDALGVGAMHDEHGEGLPQYEKANPTAPGAFPIDKKDHPLPDHPGADHGAVPDGNAHANGNAAGVGATGVTRKLSKRQQEKAPEGREAHVPPTGSGSGSGNADDGADVPGGDSGEGPGPVESRFTESL